MATPVTFNGSSFSVPAVGDRRWGQNVTNLLISLAGNALAKSGGNFTLTSEVNFGANFGVSSKYFKSITSNIAQSGIIRLANNEGIGFRNAANSSDIILKVNASDQLEFNGSLIAAATDLTALSARVTTAESDIDALQAADVTLQLNIDNKLTRSSPLDNFKTLVDTPASGFIAENAVGTFARRSIAAGSTKVSVTNAAGVSGDPTIDVVEANINRGNLTGTQAFSTVTGTVPPTQGGTGQVTANAGLNALLPTQTSQTGKFLQTDGSNTSWVASSGGLAAVATTANVSPAVPNTMYSCTSTGGFTITLPTIPALGAVIGVMDAGETCSATNFIRITPATGQSIDGYVANDSLLMDYVRANVVLYAAPGATSWKVQYQSTSMISTALDAGRYTPTLYNTSNVAASTAYSCMYSRVGNIVTVSGRVDIDPTATGGCTLGLSLPIASNLATTTDLWGTATRGNTSSYEAGTVEGDAANDRATINFFTTDAANRAGAFTFQYEVK